MTRRGLLLSLGLVFVIVAPLASASPSEPALLWETYTNVSNSSWLMLPCATEFNLLYGNLDGVCFRPGHAHDSVRLRVYDYHHASVFATVAFYEIPGTGGGAPFELLDYRHFCGTLYDPIPIAAGTTHIAVHLQPGTEACPTAVQGVVYAWLT